jgi:hypothetical protein
MNNYKKRDDKTRHKYSENSELKIKFLENRNQRLFNHSFVRKGDEK